MTNKSILTAIGATIAASLCCITPVLAVLAGSSTLASSKGGLKAWAKAGYPFDSGLGVVVKVEDE